MPASVAAAVYAARKRVFGMREGLETSLMGQSINRSARLDASRALRRVRPSTPDVVRALVKDMTPAERAAQLGSVWGNVLMDLDAPHPADGSVRRVFNPSKVRRVQGGAMCACHSAPSAPPGAPLGCAWLRDP